MAGTQAWGPASWAGACHVLRPRLCRPWVPRHYRLSGTGTSGADGRSPAGSPSQAPMVTDLLEPGVADEGGAVDAPLVADLHAPDLVEDAEPRDRPHGDVEDVGRLPHVDELGPSPAGRGVFAVLGHVIRRHLSSHLVSSSVRCEGQIRTFGWPTPPSGGGQRLLGSPRDTHHRMAMTYVVGEPRDRWQKKPSKRLHGSLVRTWRFWQGWRIGA